MQKIKNVKNVQGFIASYKIVHRIGKCKREKEKKPTHAHKQCISYYSAVDMTREVFAKFSLKEFLTLNDTLSRYYMIYLMIHRTKTCI